MISSEDDVTIELGSRPWQEWYEKARVEPDKEKLGELVLTTESAIYARFQELENSPNHDEERNSMRAATEHLLSLKVNRLGWPPVE
jgi:hypothetical protein